MMIESLGRAWAFQVLLIFLLLVSDEAHSQEDPGRRKLTGNENKCGRGRHRTQNDVTRSGDGICKHPQMSHRIDDQDVLGLMIAPLTPADFFLGQHEGPWGLQPRQLHRSDPAFYSTLESTLFENMVDFLKNCTSLSASDKHDLPSGQLNNLHDISFIRGLGNTSEIFGEPGERIEPEKAGELLEESFTVILHNADRRNAAIASIVGRLEEEFDVPVHADLYWTPPLAHSGPTRHREDEDCFILQLDGKQMWFVGGAPTSAAVAQGIPTTEQKRRAFRSARHGTFSVDMPVDERDQRVLLLRKGDALYIPRTFPHQASTNSSFMNEPSIHLAVYVAVEAVSWEAVLHRAIASVSKESHVTHYDGEDIWEQKVKLDGCSTKHQLTVADVAHWFVRGVGMTEPELRTTFVVGRQYQEAHRRHQKLHSEPGSADGLWKAIKVARAALEVSETKIVTALLSQDGVAHGVHGKSAQAWTALQNACPDAWREVSSDHQAWTQLRERLPTFFDQLEASALAQEALLLDELITWAWDAKEEERGKRRSQLPVG